MLIITLPPFREWDNGLAPPFHIWAAPASHFHTLVSGTGTIKYTVYNPFNNANYHPPTLP